MFHKSGNDATFSQPYTLPIVLSVSYISRRTVWWTRCDRSACPLVETADHQDEDSFLKPGQVAATADQDEDRRRTGTGCSRDAATGFPCHRLSKTTIPSAVKITLLFGILIVAWCLHFVSYIAISPLKIEKTTKSQWTLLLNRFIEWDNANI